MKRWIDPVEGYDYGFPAQWNDQEETLEELLDRHGYPKDMRELPLWMWSVEDES